MGLATIDPHNQKEHTEIHSLVFIRQVFTEIQRFKNFKIYKEMYGNPDASFVGQRPDGHTFLCKF